MSLRRSISSSMFFSIEDARLVRRADQHPVCVNRTLPGKDQKRRLRSRRRRKNAPSVTFTVQIWDIAAMRVFVPRDWPSAR